MQGVSIGEAAAASGVKAPTIRYYEQIGLMPVAPRTDGNYQTYNLEHRRRLQTDLFSLEQIRIPFHFIDVGELAFDIWLLIRLLPLFQ